MIYNFKSSKLSNSLLTRQFYVPIMSHFNHQLEANNERVITLRRYRIISANGKAPMGNFYLLSISEKLIGILATMVFLILEKRKQRLLC